MFTSKHYVPILKWKAAEHQALAQLSSQQKTMLTPLLQLVLPTPKRAKKGEPDKSVEEQRRESMEALKARVPLVPQQILDYWGSTPAFIDLSLLPVPAKLRASYFTQVLEGARSSGATLIPVVDLDADPQVFAAIMPYAKGTGMCLRLSRCHFLPGDKAMERIDQCLRGHAITRREVDLLVDFKAIDGNDTDSSFHLKSEQSISFTALRSFIPNLSEWRTFSFALGAFPVDLTSCKVDVKNLLPRSDWDRWCKLSLAFDTVRQPAYADYTIQHPIYNESTQLFTPSASIKYTLDDHWLIMRGRKGQNRQYLANAQLLSQMSEFYGAGFSFGDAYILEKGKDLKTPKTGNSKTWLTAGINHHLACTAQQIANLPS